MWNDTENLTEPLTQIGFFDFEELHFEVYEGKGGHLPGEIVLMDYAKTWCRQMADFRITWFQKGLFC